MYRLQTQLLSEIRFVVPVLPKSGDDHSQIFECKSIKQNDVEIYAIIRALVLELYQDRIAMRDHTFQFSAELSYREAAFIKHLSIYLCHVVLGHSMRKIATGHNAGANGSAQFNCPKAGVGNMVGASNKIGWRMSRNGSQCRIRKGKSFLSTSRASWPVSQRAAPLAVGRKNFS